MWNESSGSFKWRAPENFSAFRISEALSKGIYGLWIQKYTQMLFQSATALYCSPVPEFCFRQYSEDRSPKYFNLQLCPCWSITTCPLLTLQPWHINPGLEDFQLSVRLQQSSLKERDLFRSYVIHLGKQFQVATGWLLSSTFQAIKWKSHQTQNTTGNAGEGN